MSEFRVILKFFSRADSELRTKNLEHLAYSEHKIY